MKDFFISFNSADRPWAAWVAGQLEAAGYSTVFQDWDFQPGRNFVLEMHQAATQTKRTIAILSEGYLNARFTQAEWAAAFARDPAGAERDLIPVRVDQCNVTGLLGPIIFIDLLGKDEVAAVEVLRAGISGDRAERKRATHQSFPGLAPRFPGGHSQERSPEQALGLPEIWNVSQRPNPNFTGRDALLVKLHALLNSHQTAAAPHVLWGLGGVGKTQLAVEYARRHGRNCALVWWVRADNSSMLASDFAALATELGLARLGLAERGTYDQPSVVDAVRRWLERNGGWLLIFDNATGPEQLAGYVPRAGAGNVLITSRNRIWKDTAQPFEVRELERDKAIEFLLRRTGQDDTESAGALANELGDLPLALEHAGAYMEATGSPLREYLNHFRTRRQRLWERAKPPTGYAATVMTTWELSFQQVRGVAPEAADLLNLCAFLAPEDIPRGLLNDGARHLPPLLAGAVADQLRWDETMEAVRHYSLLERVQDALRIHRLVQAVLYDQLNPVSRRGWADVAIRLVTGAFPEDEEDVHRWPLSARLVPHALAVAGHAETLKVQANMAEQLLTRVGLYLRTRAQFAEAKAVLERSLVIAETIYRVGDPQVATIVNDLGRVLHDLGEYSRAQEAFDRALRDHQAAYGEHHPLVARDLNDLGSISLSRADPKRAIEYLRRALEIDEAIQGAQHPDVARDLGNLGRALQVLGDLHEGRASLEQSLGIDELHFGPDHPTVAADLSNLGLLLVDQHETKLAREYFQRSLQIREHVLGKEHPSTRRVRARLESVCGPEGPPRDNFERCA